MSGASALLAHVERADDLAASRLVAELPRGTISYGDSEGAGEPRFEALLDGEPTAGDLAPPTPSSPAAIFFTSGSTGPAKGVTHTHETLRWMMASAIAGLELSADDVFLPGYVTLRPDASRPSSADLIVFCRDRVGYKAPEEVVVLDEMPLNPTGKIDRVGLKRLAEDHLHPHGLD